MATRDMAAADFRYDEMIEEALRGVVRRVLRHVAKDGLPGDHHFYLTFRTDADGVELDDALRTRWPREMTIVLQHQFWDLAVEADVFLVTLSFGEVPHRLRVPFAAITAFADPAVKFGLQFTQETAAADSDPPPGEATGDASAVGDANNVVALDKFRRR
jgi:hypothetical protein